MPDINASSALLAALQANQHLTIDSRGQIKTQGAIAHFFQKIGDFLNSSAAAARMQRLGRAVDSMLAAEREVVNP
ncbi:MAG: hypothetical protein HUK26_07530, partial [Duodenibacillus sp.]|nr:hypothetical protein [Duodenibacillus sp.]